MIVAGRDDAGLAPAIPALARSAPAIRCSPTRSRAPAAAPAAIAHYDLLLRDERFAREHAPEVVIRVGDLPTSKPLREWLAGLAGARQILVDPHGGWQDPASVVETVLRADPRALSAPAGGRPGLAGRAGAPPTRAPRRASTPRSATELSEPAIARALVARAARARRPLLVAASMAGARARGLLRRSATTLRACSPTAAPTASTGRSRRPSASPPSAPGRSSRCSATSPSPTTSARC